MANPALTTLLRHVRSTADRAAECPLGDPDLLSRFLSGRDEAAFAALVRRHGGLVLAACRQLLNDPADVDDAFQATFVVLLRKAETIRHQQSLAGWLYRVASRAAAQVRQSRDCRRRHEARAAAPEMTTATVPDLSWRETCVLVHAELDRLPLRLRLPLILCYFDGKTRDEAAKQLGWSLGVLRGRLDRGRAMLRKRLARRGVELSAGVLAVVGVEAARGVTPSLLRATMRAAAPSVAGLCKAGLTEASYSGIARQVITSMTVSKTTIAATILAVGILIAGTGVLLAPAGAPPDDMMPVPAKANPQPVVAADANAFTIAGRVLGPDDKPVAGAKLFVCDNRGRSSAPQPTTDADGRFRFSLAADFTGLRAVLVTAEGFGTDWENIRPNESGDLTLRLPLDVPVRGKVVDLEGKPVVRASVEVVELSTSESGNLDEFLKRWTADKEKSVVGPTFRLLTAKSVWPRDGLKQVFATTTARDGSFQLTGIGRDRGVLLAVRGPGVANHYERLVTRPDYRPAAAGQGQTAIVGPEPTIVVSPAKAILGSVCDARTKQPLAGHRVIAYTPDQPMHWWLAAVETMTDAEGRYRLDGLTKGRHIVVCDPGPGAAHMHRFEIVGDTEGFAPATQDFELLTGVVVSGQVTDRVTGRPVRARVVYAPLLNNPSFETTPGYAGPQMKFTYWIDSREMITGPDGRFRLTALPGPGGLFVRAFPGMGTYAAPPPPATEDRQGGVYDERAETFYTIGLGDIFPLPDQHGYRIIRPAADATELTADFALDPGLRLKGRLYDPAGQPLTGARAIGLPSRPFRKYDPLPGAEFTAEALSLAKPRRLFFWHEERKLAGTVVLRGDEPEPVTVTLHPLATLTGRAIAKTGEPLVAHSVEYSGWPEIRLPHEDGKRRDENPVLTDADGRFRLTDLPSGVPLTVSVIVPKTRFATIHREKIVLQPGQTKDLGELRATPKPE